MSPSKMVPSIDAARARFDSHSHNDMVTDELRSTLTMIYHSTGGAVWTRRQSWAQFDTPLNQWEGVTMDMTCFGVNAHHGLSKCCFR